MPSADTRRSAARRAVPAALVAVAFVVPLALIVGGSLRPAGLPESIAVARPHATLHNYLAFLETEPPAHEALVSLVTDFVLNAHDQRTPVSLTWRWGPTRSV
jgi:hypothetical protein